MIEKNKIGIEVQLTNSQKIGRLEINTAFDPSSPLLVAHKDPDVQEISPVNYQFLHTSGIGIVEVHCLDTTPQNILFTIDSSHILLSFLTNYSPANNHIEAQSSVAGKIYINYHNGSDIYQYNISGPEHSVFIVFSREYYLQIFQNETFSNYFDLYNAVKDFASFSTENNGLPLSIPVKHILRKIFNNPFQDAVKKFYIEAKLKGLFSLLQEERMRKLSQSLHYVREDILEKIHQAKTILDNNFHVPPTIKQLSRMIVLNEKDLKAHFKSVYGLTIRNYLVKLRMEAAYSMINDKNVMIFEVALRLGYKDTSHFINMFKKYFGYTPKYFCKHVKLSQLFLSLIGLREIGSLFFCEM